MSNNNLESVEPKLPWYKSSALKFRQVKMKHIVWFMLAQASIGQVDEQGTNLILPSIQEALQIDAATSKWLMTLYYLAIAVGAVPFASLGKKFGQINIILICNFLGACLYLAAFFVKNLYGLFILRFLHGLVQSGILSNRNTCTSILPHPDQRQTVLRGQVVTGAILGLILPIGTMLIVNYTAWNVVFLIPAALNLIAFAITLPYQNPPKSKAKFDWLGALLLAATLVGFCLAVNYIGTYEWMWVGICTAIFAIALVGFCFVELKEPEPILPLKLMVGPVGGITLLNLMTNIVSMSKSYEVPQLLAPYKTSLTTLGMFSSGIAAIMLVTSFVVSKATKHIVYRYTLAISSTLAFVVLLIFGFLMNSEVEILTMHVISGAIIPVTAQQLFPLLMSSVPPAQAHLVSGIPPVTRTMGNSISFCLVATVYSIVLDQTKDTVLGYSIATWIVAGLCIIMVLIELFVIGNSPVEAAKKGFSQKWVRTKPLKPQAAQKQDEPTEEQPLLNKSLASDITLNTETPQKDQETVETTE